jgi:hypothetical protein
LPHHRLLQRLASEKYGLKIGRYGSRLQAKSGRIYGLVSSLSARHVERARPTTGKSSVSKPRTTIFPIFGLSRPVAFRMEP